LTEILAKNLIIFYHYVFINGSLKEIEINRQSYFITIAHIDKQDEPVESLFKGKRHLQAVLRNMRYLQSRRKEIDRDRANRSWAWEGGWVKSNTERI